MGSRKNQVKDHRDIHWDTLNYAIYVVPEDDIHVASVREFPNLKAHGPTIDEAAKNLREVLRVTLDDMYESGELVPCPMPYHGW